MHARIAEIKTRITENWEEVDRTADMDARMELHVARGHLAQEQQDLEGEFAELIRRFEDLCFEAGREAERSGGYLSAATLKQMEQVRGQLRRSLY